MGRDQEPAPHIVVTHISTRTNGVGKGGREGDDREWARYASHLKPRYVFCLYIHLISLIISRHYGP